MRYLKQITDLDDVHGTAAYARAVRERFSNRKLEGYEVRVSWSLDELDPNNPDDVDIAVAFGYELCHKLFPNFPVVVTAHGDGDGGCLHVHCDIVNNDIQTDRAIRGDNRDHYHVAKTSDELAEGYGFRRVERHHSNAWSLQRQKHERDLEDYGARESGAWSRPHMNAAVRLAIGDVVAEALNDDDVVDVEPFERVLLERYGCEIRRKEVKKRDGTVVAGFTYAMPVEINGRTRMRRSKASAICPEFDANHIEQTIDARLVERLRQQEADSNGVELGVTDGVVVPSAEPDASPSYEETVAGLVSRHDVIRQRLLYDDDGVMNGVCLMPNPTLFGDDGVEAASFTLMFDNVRKTLDRVDMMYRSPSFAREYKTLPPAPTWQDAVEDFVGEYQRSAERVVTADTDSRPTPETFVGEVLGMCFRTVKHAWTRITTLAEACAYRLGARERVGNTFGQILRKVVGKRAESIEPEPRRRSVKPRVVEDEHRPEWSEAASVASSKGKLDESDLNTLLSNTLSAIEASSVGFESEEDFRGLFDDFDTSSKRLLQLMDGIGGMDLGDFGENRIDAFGDAYEFLMRMYASNAGKSGGEFFTPPEVSKLLMTIALDGRDHVNKVYEIKTPYWIQINDCPLRGVA
ncbi:MAG: relaxase/mobilization nuclease domain-containing protein [Atopobiaceae bacterium]|nr:relaxase/mobilization nuclease domain-containing protein [Atopobiaceae bacterium]